MSKKSPSLHVLRGILRKTIARGAAPIEPKLQRSSSRQYVMAQYRASNSIQSHARVQELQDTAHEYYTLQKDISERSRLHKLDTGAEEQLTPKELSRRAAARAGLQLPELDPTLE